MYWPHTLPFVGSEAVSVLRQSNAGQAEIVSEISRFRTRHAADPSAPLFQARTSAPVAFEQMVAEIEWKLIQMPLPRVQRMGSSDTRFIYEIGWDESVTRRVVGSPTFDNRVLLVGQAADHLVRLSGLLRPLIELQWTAMVARRNREVADEMRLQTFLFGDTRIDLTPIQRPLRELQDNRCFYCGQPMQGRADVDHFIPWSRYPDNGIQNLVAAHPRCNGEKRDFIAASDHLERWVTRSSTAAGPAEQLESIAERLRWEHQPERTFSVARAIYLRLPIDARLWVRGGDFVSLDRERVRSVLQGTQGSSVNSPTDNLG